MFSVIQPLEVIIRCICLATAGGQRSQEKKKSLRKKAEYYLNVMLFIKGIYIYNLSLHEDPGLKASQSNLENCRKLNMQREGRKEERQEEEEEEGVGGLEKEQLGQLWLLLYTA